MKLDRRIADQSDDDCIDILEVLLDLPEEVLLPDKALMLRLLGHLVDKILLAERYSKDQKRFANLFIPLFRLGINILKAERNFIAVQEVIDFYNDWEEVVSEAAGLKPDFEILKASRKEVKDIKFKARMIPSLLAEMDDVQFQGVQPLNTLMGKSTEGATASLLAEYSPWRAITTTLLFPYEKIQQKEAAIFGEISPSKLYLEDNLVIRDNILSLYEKLKSG